MLYSQIPQGIKSRIATEIKIDLKILSTTFKDKEKQSDETMYSKLQVVEKHLHEHSEVGTIEEPRSYFHGVLDMRWGEYPDTGIVYFTGLTGGTAVGLGGSLKHVIGHQNTERLRPLIGSLPNPLLQALITELRIPILQELEDFLFRDEKRLLKVVRQSLYRVQGTRQRVEFLAKRLAQEEAKDAKAILGTPLYVALAK